MTWQIFLIINLIFASIREFLYKKLAEKHDPLVSLIYLFFFSVIWLNLIYLWDQKSIASFNPILSLPGAIFAIGFVAYFHALKLSLSQSILFQSYSIVITIVLAAIFLGEVKYFDLTNATGQKVLAGTLLALFSLWFLLHTGKNKEEKIERKWFFYIGLTILALGIGSFFSISYLKNFSPVYILINQNELAAPLLLLVAVMTKKKFVLKKKLVLLILVNSLVATIAVLAFYEALRYIPVSKLFPIQQVSLVIITIIVGIIYFKEKQVLSGKRLIGMILGLGGILLLLTS